MSKISENVIARENKTVPAKYQEVFDKMDAYRRGEISFQEYTAIPIKTVNAARAWRRKWIVNPSLETCYPDMNLDSDI